MMIILTRKKIEKAMLCRIEKLSNNLSKNIFNTDKIFLKKINLNIYQFTFFS